MTPQLIHDDDGWTYACPECGRGGEVYRRIHENRDFDYEYRCSSCSAEFDEPDERKYRHTPPVERGDDDLPHGLDQNAKELIRQARGLQ